MRAVIWTTTPWTIPANQALAVHPDLAYSLVETDRGSFILASELVDACLARFGIARKEPAGRFEHQRPGARSSSIRFRHPFYDRESPVQLGEFVTLEQGTGIVHSSPAYGIDDFQSGRRYGLTDDQILNPVQGDGRYAETLPFFGGLNIWKANPLIVDKLREVGALLHAEKITHSYMHCWRHKTPIIYRATTQWFAGMDDVPGWRGIKPEKTLRETALAGVEATQFFPALGQGAAVRNDRQPARLDLVAAAAMGRAAAVFRRPRDRCSCTPTRCRCSSSRRRRSSAAASRSGRRRPTRISASIRRSIASSPTRLTCGSIPEPRTRRSWAAPTARRKHLGSHPDQTGFPADLYLEGSDQHRGWFHSSLLSSCMLNGVPPYKALLTHGFAVDGDGKKMSKSKGNVVAPQTVSDTLGAEILRLWVGATDYSGELSISNEILKRVVEGYRRIRNTLRFLLANTSDFDPARHAVPAAELLELDRYALDVADSYFDDMRQKYARVRISPGRAGAAAVLFGRARRTLSRHPEGPPLHDGRRIRRRDARRRRRLPISATN